METRTLSHSSPSETAPETAARPAGDEGARVADEILSAEEMLPEAEAGYYVRSLVDERLRIVAITSVAVFLSVVLALVLPRFFTAHVTMLPTDDGESGFPSQLSGIASSIGLQFPFGSVSQSDLYPTILASDRLLSGILDERFAPEPGAEPMRLLDIVVEKKQDLTDHEHRMAALRELRENVVRSHKDSDTGVISLSVTTPDAELSATLANRLVTRLETYLIDTRMVEGSRNRTFLDDRLAVVSVDLRKAEETLKKFRETNRRIEDSPELLLQQERLSRDVLMQEQIFLELQRQKEVAKIEEVKNTPVLRVLDEATPPVRPSRPHKVIVVAMGFVLGLIGALGFVLVRAALRLSPETVDALRPFVDDLHRVVGFVRRRRSANA
jgi:uncharacterized protein involved in exopolysaccharide biosynthesis